MCQFFPAVPINFDQTEPKHAAGRGRSSSATAVFVMIFILKNGRMTAILSHENMNWAKLGREVASGQAIGFAEQAGT